MSNSKARRWLLGIVAAFAGLLVPLVNVIAAGDEPVSAEEAQESYDTNCAMCHGYDGIPMLPGAPNFFKGERLEKSDAELLKTITEGKNAMPPWAAMLSETEQKAILIYVRSFAPRQ